MAATTHVLLASTKALALDACSALLNANNATVPPNVRSAPQTDSNSTAHV